MTDNTSDKTELAPLPQLQEPQQAHTQQEDIDNLYNELGTLIKSNSTNDVSSLSSISSSSSNTTSQSMSCACKHWLVSMETKHCSLCDAVVPLLEKLQTEKQKLKERIQSLKSQLDDQRSLLNSYKRDHGTLSAQYAQREQQSDAIKASIESLQQDIHFLKTKHKDEIAHTLEIEQSKKGVEIELHDLSQKLFEEANALVLAEKKEKLILQQEHDQVKLQLENTQIELAAVQTELQTLREVMADQPQETTTAKTTHENYTLRAQLDMATLLGVPQPVEINPNIQKDGLLLQEFDTFIQSLEITSMAKVNSLPFMKYIIKSDIEPCLKFGKATSKRVLEAILSKTCLIEECPQEFIDMKKQQPPIKAKPKSRLWGFSSSPMQPNETAALPILGCSTCGKELEEGEDQMWRFRTSYFDEWALIDGYCRDRINSVVAFYAWLRRIKVQQTKKTELDEAYEEFTRLQLQMLLSRMGALPCLLNTFGLETQ
ncbi:uncharacterized protein ATC70_013188 [Mucor velutinosus]|uniref:GDP/GTP exchange factor Sec2 N-terminal domain-containing protein n=1 Tax=Mucor velutinosus TaxID=708070 RepID=A0AAN7I3X2_9FUNG|nr:hypothetical protein ATC70_013188 [Mucor velutinosus]